MAAKIAMVSIKPEYVWGEMPLFRPLLKSRKWIPVYYPAHTDPDLGFAAARPHFHIAWNRISVKHRPPNAADKPVWQWWVDKIRVLNKPLKIISPPCVIRRTRYPEIEAWKKI